MTGKSDKSDVLEFSLSRVGDFVSTRENGGVSVSCDFIGCVVCIFPGGGLMKGG